MEIWAQRASRPVLGFMPAVSTPHPDPLLLGGGEGEEAVAFRGNPAAGLVGFSQWVIWVL